MAACGADLVALWIHSSLVFIKMMTKKLSVQHPTTNLPHGRQCSHDLLALTHTQAHSDLLKPLGVLCHSAVRLSKGWRLSLSYLLWGEKEKLNRVAFKRKDGWASGKGSFFPPSETLMRRFWFHPTETFPLPASLLRILQQRARRYHFLLKHFPKYTTPKRWSDSVRSNQTDLSDDIVCFRYTDKPPSCEQTEEDGGLKSEKTDGQ